MPSPIAVDGAGSSASIAAVTAPLSRVGGTTTVAAAGEGDQGDVELRGQPVHELHGRTLGRVQAGWARRPRPPWTARCRSSPRSSPAPAAPRPGPWAWRTPRSGSTGSGWTRPTARCRSQVRSRGMTRSNIVRPSCSVAVPLPLHQPQVQPDQRRNQQQQPQPARRQKRQQGNHSVTSTGEERSVGPDMPRSVDGPGGSPSLRGRMVATGHVRADVRDDGLAGARACEGGWLRRGRASAGAAVPPTAATITATLPPRRSPRGRRARPGRDRSRRTGRSPRGRPSRSRRRSRCSRTPS